MTIARTGNSIVDAQARRGAAEAKREESRKAAATKKSAKSGKSAGKSGAAASRKSRGKAAAGRGGRGIVIKKSKAGKGFGGLLNYMMSDLTAKLITSNAGYDKKSMAQHMRNVAELNPKVKNPVGHLIVALPPSEKKSEGDWQKIVDHIVNEIEIRDHPHTAVLHETAKGQDLHICYSRVDLNGEVLNDSNDKYLLAFIEQDCEQRFNLKLVPRDQMKSRKNDTPNVTLGEVRQAERTQIKPPRLVVSDAIKLARKDKPTAQVFIERLRADGVIAAPYVNAGEMKGFSFSLDGQSFKGKDVAASWTLLSKELDYEQDRDLDQLAVLSGQARADTRGSEPIEERARPTPDRAPGTEVKIPESGRAVEQPSPASASTKNQAKAPEPDRSNPVLHSLTYKDDPIAKRVRDRQATIDRLRRETGERHKLAQELARRMESGDLYRQRQIAREFIADHKADSQAMAIVKSHLPEMAPTAPVRPPAPAPELPERLKIADRYQEPPPSERTDHQFPTM